MKRRELEQQLRLAGCYLKRQGSEHALWINPHTGVIEAVPRHAETKEPLARKILRNLLGDQASMSMLSCLKVRPNSSLGARSC